MPAQIGQGVTLRGIFDEDYSYTWNLSGTNGVAPPDSCPLMIDTTAANTLKVATDGAFIMGWLRVYENRKQEGIVVGSVLHKGQAVFPYTGSAPVIGNAVVGSGTVGSVKDAGAAGTRATNFVVEVDTVGHFVTVAFF